MTPLGKGSRNVRTVEADVAVVGAGMAGLAAATELKRRDASFVVLEARDRVGGRVQSLEVEPNRWIDVGGQWVGPTQDRLYALAREHGAATFPTWTAGENVLEMGGRLVRYRGTIPRLRPHALADVGQAMMRIDRMAAKVPLEAPWEAPKAHAWDSQTTWSWLRRNMATRGGRDLMEVAVKAVWAAMPADVSFLHFLFYVASAGKLDLLLDTDGGAQQDRFVEGAGGLAATVGATLGDRLVLSAPVRRIEWTPDAARVHADGVEVRAQRVIVAVPPTLAGRLWYDPPLPGYRDQLTQRVPMGAVIKCFAIYDEPFWRAEGLSGSAVSSEGPLTLTVDNSPPDGGPGILVGFLEGRSARELGRVERGRAPCGGAGQPRSPVRPPRRATGALPGQELGRRGMDPRLLRGIHATRGADCLRAGPARADRAVALGRDGDGDRLERLHRRRAPVWRAGGPRGARGRAGTG